MQHHKNCGLTYCKQLIANKDIHTMCTLVQDQQILYFNKKGIVKHCVLFLEKKFQLFDNLEKGALRHFEIVHPSIVFKFE